jgi:hypothetical protein
VEGESPEFVVLPVRVGELPAESWVYVWIEAATAVVYVGATGLDPRTRAWLHLHDADPDVGRMAARFDRLGTAELDVLAMVVPEELSRADVRDVLGVRLSEEGLLADDAIVDHLQLPLEAGQDAVELAERFLGRLRAHLAQGEPELP